MEADGGNERQLEGKWQCELSAKAVEGRGEGGSWSRSTEEKKCGGEKSAVAREGHKSVI